LSSYDWDEDDWEEDDWEEVEEIRVEKPAKRLSSSKVEIVKDIVRELKALLKELNQKDKDYDEHLGEDRTNRREITRSYPRYRRREACYAISKFLEEEVKLKKLCDYASGEYSPVSYFSLEIKRGELKSLPSEGTAYIYYKDKPFIVSLDLEYKDPWISIVCRNEDDSLAEEIFKRIDEMMNTLSFLKGEKLELTYGVDFEFLDYPKRTWDDIVLSPKTKREILLNIIYPIENRDILLKNRLPWKRGILLEGFPGTGKTLLGKILCNELKDITFILVSSKSIGNKSHISLLFKAARILAPTLLFFEDIDLFGRDRERGDTLFLGELLNQLDGIRDNEGVFVVATTNRPSLLDKALLHRPSRFDVKIRFELPSSSERLSLVNLYSKGVKMSKEIRSLIASRTEGFTPAMIKEVIVYSRLLSLFKGSTLRDDIVKSSISILKESMRMNRERYQDQKGLIV